MKRLPTEIKKQRGTLRKDRMNDNEPKLPSVIPPIPTWLSEDGQKAFSELSTLLHDMSVLTQADELALTLLCDAYSEYKKAKEVVNELGSTMEVTSREGNTKSVIRPEVQIANQSFVRVFQLLKEFGLTPSSRAKVNAIENASTTPDVKIENFFNSGE
jgi:P27 family predicted phage terminase small subunit|tara:strand:- start:367 stop:840 length:474 start_codon:yes stop_codon:yes gene_type:complete